MTQHLGSLALKSYGTEYRSQHLLNKLGFPANEGGSLGFDGLKPNQETMSPRRTSREW